MINSSIAARQRGCLRHQLRDALRQCRADAHLQAPANTFFTQAARYSEASETSIVEQPESIKDVADTAGVQNSNIIRKSLNPSGHVITRKGVRQRVISKRISRDSLDKPSYVIVFREEDLTQSKKHRKAMQAQAQFPQDLTTEAAPTQVIEADAIIQSTKPQQEEVNDSIDGLKPQSSVIDKTEFERLVTTLSQSYNMVQLRSYLVSSVGRWRWLSAGEIAANKELGDKIHDLSSGVWQAGRTPLHERHEKKVKSSGSSKKVMIAHNILRLAWNVVVQSEEQQIGELEISVKPWQLRMLFDVDVEQRPQFETLLASKLLIQTSDVRPYRPDNVVRVTARRQDSEEIARRLRLALLEVERLEFDLKPFTPLLGRHGWPDKLADLYSDEDLKFVSANTGVLIEREDDALGIYSFKQATDSDAQRLLLSLLESHSASSHSSTFLQPKYFQTGVNQHSPQPLLLSAPTDPTATTLHWRYRNKALVRSVAPHAKQRRETLPKLSEEQAPKSRQFDVTTTETLAGDIEASILQVPAVYQKTKDVLNHKDSYWGTTVRLRHQNWRAQFCKLLHDNYTLPSTTHSLDVSSNSSQHVPAYEVPGIEPLLSYFGDKSHFQPTFRVDGHRRAVEFQKSFKRARGDARVPNLIAYFSPSPFASDGVQAFTSLPKIELRFWIAGSRYGTGAGELNLYGLRAILDEQFHAVPLPDQAVDLLFARTVLMFADRNAITQDPQIGNVVRQLRNSYVGGGALSITPEVAFKLPHWLAKGEEPAEGSEQYPDVPVTYLFERFEQIQSYDLVPTKDESLLANLGTHERGVLSNLSEGHHLEYRQVEGGPVNGNQTFLSLRVASGEGINMMTGDVGKNSALAREVGDPHASEQSDALSVLERESDETLRAAPTTLLRLFTKASLDIAQLLTQADSEALPRPGKAAGGGNKDRRGSEDGDDLEDDE